MQEIKYYELYTIGFSLTSTIILKATNNRSKQRETALLAIKYTEIMTTDIQQREVSDKPKQFDKQDAFFFPPDKRSYGHQYREIYEARAKQLKSRVMKMASMKWKNETINGEKAKYVNKLLDVKSMTPSYVIGTVFMDMKYKPNILREATGNIYAAPEFKDDSEYDELERTRIHSYSDPSSDQVMLEDESGRLLLDGELLDKVVLMTGVVIGALGMIVEAGVFTIVDVVYPEAAVQIPRSIEDKPEQFVMYLSGLRIKPSSKRASLEVLKEFIMGQLTNEDNIGNLLKRTTNLVILGSSIEVTAKSQKDLSDKDKYRAMNKSNFDAQSLEILDKWISDLLVSIPVSIMPGETDPAEIEYPKMPFHKSLFRLSSGRRNFERLTNPAWLQINDDRILATSGENVNDMFKYMIPNIHVEVGSGIDSPVRREILYDSRLKLLQSNILWQNVAPTAPDTLPCYPFTGTDLFTLNETPHVYVVGCQPKFETTKLEMSRRNGEKLSVQIISVPDFEQTGQCVFMNTKTLECTSARVVDQ